MPASIGYSEDDGFSLGWSPHNNNSRADRDMQRQFAKHGIRWKVQDAKAAGIHPLAALGVSPSQAAPTAVGGDPAGGMQYQENKYYDAEMQERIKSTELQNKIADQQRKQEQMRTWEMGYELEKKMKLDGFNVGKEGSRSNPMPIYLHGKDKYSGNVYPFPNSELFEGYENVFGKGAGMRAIGKENLPDKIFYPYKFD